MCRLNKWDIKYALRKKMTYFEITYFILLRKCV